MGFDAGEMIAWSGSGFNGVDRGLVFAFPEDEELDFFGWCHGIGWIPEGFCPSGGSSLNFPEMCIRVFHPAIPGISLRGMPTGEFFQRQRIWCGHF